MNRSSESRWIICGIAGIATVDGLVDSAVVRAMTERLRHRGPDDSGVWIAPHERVGLGHTRLSIIDLSSAARQPIANENGDVQLVCNGEIYNFRTLRQELQKCGHRFRSDTDSEVVLHGYEEWGDDVVQRLHGMFAFAIWDDRRQRLLLARDRLGIKPLYFETSPQSFSFASELKALPNHDRHVDVSALWDYFTYGYVPAPKTPYKSTQKLQAGHLLVFENGKYQIDEYWDVDFSSTRKRSDDHLVEELRELLSRSVESHLVSDVPIGSLLSAGLDSSAVTALAVRQVNSLRTYTVGFRGFEWCESEPARRLARSLGTDHHEFECEARDGRQAAERMSHWFDEPFADLSAIPTSLVCRNARRDVIVVLSGDGGDEVFGGYRHYRKFLDLGRRDILPSFIRRPVGTSVAKRSHAESKLRRTALRWAMEDIERFVAVHGGMTRAEKALLLPKAVLRHFEDYDDYWSFRRYWRTDLDAWSRMQYVDLKTYLPDDLLVKVDRVSMDVGLEVRPPLLDHRIVEFAASVPHEERTPDGELKHLFKRAIAPLVPEEQLLRKKQGFSVPAEDWMREGVFGNPGCADGWPSAHRLSWSLFGRWASECLGVDDPMELFMDQPSGSS